ncbi:MAG: hypothetical protein K8I82_01670 [Anaerolineae bacterium]|nr:hypothetical protein [Anaerolineae bacterium]
MVESSSRHHRNSWTARENLWVWPDELIAFRPDLQEQITMLDEDTLETIAVQILDAVENAYWAALNQAIHKYVLTANPTDPYDS